MKNSHDEDMPNLPLPRPSRRARLEALLFTGAALGTTLLMLAGPKEPKLPPFKGE